jgi:hypothetical protein
VEDAEMVTVKVCAHTAVMDTCSAVLPQARATGAGLPLESEAPSEQAHPWPSPATGVPEYRRRASTLQQALEQRRPREPGQREAFGAG